MHPIDTVIVGGGQAGLALSRCLGARGRAHVVLERGRIGERWRSERWDSLRLLTPNWMTRLPGWEYRGEDPHGFMSRGEVVAFLDGYARSFTAPVLEAATVTAVAPAAGEWRVESSRGTWRARHVVIATGDADRPRRPVCAAQLAPALLQLDTSSYRSPRQLPPGGVLVVGASASGAQLADELRSDGREVVLAVGRHNRLPRRYRGRDIMWWLDRTGSLDRDVADHTDPASRRREPSLQLSGRAGGETLDLAVLAGRGVRLAGRLIGVDGWRADFAPDLACSVSDAGERLTRTLDRIDRHIAAHGLDARLPAPEPMLPVAVPEAALTELDLRQAGISTVLWATGYRRDYSWLQAPVLDAGGEIVHHRGRTAVPGLYVLGLRFLTRRRSSFLDGVGRDAEEIAESIARGFRAAAA